MLQILNNRKCYQCQNRDRVQHLEQNRSMMPLVNSKQFEERCSQIAIFLKPCLHLRTLPNSYRNVQLLANFTSPIGFDLLRHHITQIPLFFLLCVVQPRSQEISSLTGSSERFHHVSEIKPKIQSDAWPGADVPRFNQIPLHRIKSSLRCGLRFISLSARR